jgi:hypothetical protein
VCGQATGWGSMWQRFMTRLLKETDVKERFTEHDLRAKSVAMKLALRGQRLTRSREQRDYKARLSTQARSHQAGPLTRYRTRANGGNTQSLGEDFAFLKNGTKNLLFFGPCRDRTYDQLIKRTFLQTAFLF